MHAKSVVERQWLAEALVTPPGVSRVDFLAGHCPPLRPNHGPTSQEPAALGQYGSIRGYVRRHWKAEDWRMDRWACCRLTERMDAEIGVVLAALRETGMPAKSVVVISSDHGDMDAAHGFAHKSLSYEESARVPFVVSWKGRMAGLPGRSVWPLVERGRAAGWREEVAIECGDSRTIRSRRYKYSRFAGGAPREMLSVLEWDPGEARFAGVWAEHRRRLRARVEELGDEFWRGLLG